MFKILKSNAFTNRQLKLLKEITPASEIEIKEDENGVKYKVVKGSYMKKRMSLIFGNNFDFQILNREFFSGCAEVIVHAKLTVHSRTVIVREQFGKHNVTFAVKSSGNRKTSAPLNIGNAFKSAATDAFKKCASEIGLCWDIYSQEIPEPEKDEVKEEISHQEQSITERLEHFLKSAKTTEELEDIVQRFKDSNELTSSQQLLIDDYKNKLNSKTSDHE